MFQLIKSVLKSIELYLTLKNKKFYYELHKQFKDKEKKIVQEIEDFRILGDSHSADRADLLRDYLDTERREFEHLSAIYSKIGEEENDRNS
jgi:hypothetical protein|tara:strand:- start:1295 stop:1567 length:273 start_codon:yes stop_codon:yes gene_type:complete